MVLPALKSIFVTKWQLIRKDFPPATQIIFGQFQAEDYTEEVSTVWTEMPIPKRREPHIQWVRGEAETASFAARLWANHVFEDVKDAVDALKNSIQPDPDLARPIIWTFIWGDISYDCVVQSVGGVKYDEKWVDGRTRGAYCTITLRRIYDYLSISPVDPALPSFSTRYRPATTGDTYESMAQKEYNSPLIGIFIRQDNLVAFPQPGEIVAMPKLRNFVKRKRAPIAYALSSEQDAKATMIELFDEMATPKTMPFISD